MGDRSSLLAFTSIPTATGHESRVARWVEDWASSRHDVRIERDGAQNITVLLDPSAIEGFGGFAEGAPILFTGHLDHPAMVVERVVAPSVVACTLRGGVMADYLADARVWVHSESGRLDGTVREKQEDAPGPLAEYLVELDDESEAVAVGDCVTWSLADSAVERVDGNELLRTQVCDDLASVHAAFDAMDRLREKAASGEPIRDVRILLTMAEEVGFVGAIAACRLGTIPDGSRVIALECSRASANAPIGGGPIVRVGDRISVFSPALTAAVAKRAEEIAGAPAPTASQKLRDAPDWKWQRKLMAGGACEASVYCAFGHESTCVCLPLGNYHNMGDLDAVQAGTNSERARLAREEISLSDYDGLVDLLTACGERLGRAGGFLDRIEKLWDERKYLVGM